ncbi:recombinase family protein [uncultured Aggregatibacter sp.]|uniref:recombinase family protein n=1 Tax=uncultured Aggregatibacter sp. TaxID=470564 RepID=UPI001A5D360C|nr:recombinase family protein [uncultured Aggregatibacter sp.]VTX60579.1 Putative transposon Tn552 DNA-invertase bin3 [uncultured Aggregatibacter sp.]
MAKIGFARVSTLQQDLNEQIRILQEYGCKKIFSGKHSGVSIKNKEQLDELLNYIREGDVVVVTKLDRLGRSLTQCLNTLELFKKRKVGFIAIQQGINTQTQDNPMGTALIQLLGIFAELERSFIVERTQEGKRAKLAAGQKNALGGRPPKVTDKLRREIYKDFEKGVSINIATQKYNLSRATIARLKGNFNRSKIST